MRVSMTGIGRYTYELAKGLRDADAFESLKFQFLLGWVDSPETLIHKYHASKAGQSAGSRSPIRQRFYHAARSVFRVMSPTVQGMLAGPYRDYIYHSPSFVVPRFHKKCVSTVHDMSAFRVPQYHPASRVNYQREIFRHLLKKGSLFITDSVFSRAELLDFFPLPEDRVVSVPLGVDGAFQPRPASALRERLAIYGLEADRYVLCVGTIEPRKNVEHLIDAYAKLNKGLWSEWPLVLVGGYGWNSEHIHQKIARYSQEGWLKYLAFAEEEDLPFIYSGARLFVFVSRYEGFGLPVLEAMASGVPVISSNAASLPEVGGDAVVYVEPNNVEQLVETLTRVLGDDVERSLLSERGYVRSQSFSWQRTVYETIDAYRRIA